MGSNKPTQEQVRELLHYNPNTGIVIRKVKTCNRVKIGDVFGSESKHDEKTYLKATLHGKLFYVHRLIWLYMTGEWPAEVDHEDGDGLNNKWNNLRDAGSRTENNKNHRLQENNTSSCTGVHLYKRTGKWTASINKNMHLGTHNDFFEAVCARKSAENKHGFHTNHGSIRPL